MASHNIGLYDSIMGHIEDPVLAHPACQRKMSPMSTDSTASSSSPHNDSGLWAHSPNVDTDCSDFSVSSPPASDDGFVASDPMQHYATATQDWDLLSEMLIDDALNTMHAGPAPQSFGSHAGYEAFNGAPHKTLYDQQLPFQPPQHQQNQIQQFHQHQQDQHQQDHLVQHQQRQFTSGFMDALLMQDDAAMAMAMAVAPPSSSAATATTGKQTNAMGSPQTTDLFPGVSALSLPVLPSPLSSSGLDFSTASPSQSPAPPPPRATANKARKISSVSTASSSSSSSSSSVAVIKSEPHASPDELKKLRRRSQIASSVQRHREKKKCLVATLKSDLSSLTSQLTTLRAQRKSLHATSAVVTTSSSRLAEWEEEAITQRRKRKQSEELNQQMKQALFQQTCFLQGLRSLMGATNSNSIMSPTTREMQIHDYLHAYTALSASRDQAVRHREYMACFPQGKVDLAHQIVLRETDPFAGRLTTSANPYFAEIRVLHDGTDVVHDEQDVQLRRELREPREWAVPGSGAVVKKYTSMFLFEERGRCTLEAFQHVALEATKSVGVFWPSPGYSASALETIAIDDRTQLIYSDLHGSMALIDGECGVEQGENADRDDVQLEARMLCRVQHTADATVIAWDYADKDDRLPICSAGRRNTSIRRDSCGAAVVQREPGGKISFRSVCVKMFRPMEEDEDENKNGQEENKEDRVEARAVVQRRINLQASEKERQNQKCVRSVYESLATAFTKK